MEESEVLGNWAGDGSWGVPGVDATRQDGVKEEKPSACEFTGN